MAHVGEKNFKRIIVCCDGSWMDSLGSKGGLPQSNVSRLSRVIKRTCSHDTHQVILYDAGVGTGALKADQLTGGGFGMGLSVNMRECYNFICSNYVDGDDIILVGFSRGAFTARSVADMIGTIGLLTATGLDYFYPIFEDYEHLADPKATLQVCDSDIPAFNEKGAKTKREWVAERKQNYKRQLKDRAMTRDTFSSDPTRHITIKALAVWDTVGSLGIPPLSVWPFQTYGSAKQWKFSGTAISDRVKYAFQALALDEPRSAFKPALWERLPENKVTKLKQVWFPGNHGGVGGGCFDQQMADISLAWMCDQLSTVGVEFNFTRMKQILEASLYYSANHPFPFIANWADTFKMPTSVTSWAAGPPIPWAKDPIFSGANPLNPRDTGDCDERCKKTHIQPNTPEDQIKARLSLARPWALGQTRYPSRVQTLIGSGNRHPGLYTRTDPYTNKPLNEPLVHTEERIHSSVRVRLACQGLSMDDAEVWKCEPLRGGDGEKIGTRRITAGSLWKLERGDAIEPEEREMLKSFKPNELDADEHSANEYPTDQLYDVQDTDGRFQWVFADDKNLMNAGTKNQVPQFKAIPEEPLVGYWERYLLGLTTGKHDVWRYAEKNPGF